MHSGKSNHHDQRNRYHAEQCRHKHRSSRCCRVGSILFGGLYILNIYIPGLNRATQELVKMAPYVLTIIVLILSSRRNKLENQPPESLGVPYFREER